MEIITLKNYSEFNQKLIDLGFYHIKYSINKEEYFILMQNNGETYISLNIAIQNELYHKSIVLMVKKCQSDHNNTLKILEIHNEIPFDKVIELKEKYS